jgi:hypothetical protein
VILSREEHLADNRNRRPKAGGEIDFDQRLMDFIKRHPEHDQEWLTVQQGPLAVTPANIRAFLRSMQEESVVSRAELTTM